MKKTYKIKKNFSLSTLTIQQIEALSTKLNISQTEVVQRAIERMYREQNGEAKHNA